MQMSITKTYVYECPVYFLNEQLLFAYSTCSAAFTQNSLITQNNNKHSSFRMNSRYQKNRPVAKSLLSDSRNVSAASELKHSHSLPDPNSPALRGAAASLQRGTTNGNVQITINADGGSTTPDGKISPTAGRPGKN